MQWKRPDDIPVGKMWLRFKGRDRSGAPGLMYQIRDVEEAHIEMCLDLMQETFLRDEPINKTLDVINDAESVTVIRNNWKRLMDQKVSVACFTEENGEPKEVVGFNTLLVVSKGDEEEDVEKAKGDKWRKILKTLTHAEELVDVFSIYGVDSFLTCSGLTVARGHRGQNIAARLLEAREKICKEFGIPATSSVFTAPSSQALASKCGFEVLATLQYTDMLPYGVDLTGCECPDAKVMGRKYSIQR